MQNLHIPYPKQVFIYGDDERLAKSIVNELEMQPAGMHVQKFSDGESIPHQTETVRDRDVYIILTSQNGPESDSWLSKYLRFVYSIYEGEPHKITVILPKLPYQRQDRENPDLRQPKLSGWYPSLLKTMGADRVIVCKLHNPASRTTEPRMQNIGTTMLITDHIRSKHLDLSRLAIGAGDMSGAKYARKIASELGVPLVIAEKDRDQVNPDQTKVMKVYTEGLFSDKIDSVEFVDDLISTFGTLKNAADAVSLKYSHVKSFGATATHPDFGEETSKNIIDSKFESVCVTDTVPVGDEFVKNLQAAGKKIIILSVARLIARTIDNLHNGKSVSALWVNNNGLQKTVTSN